MPPRPRNPIGGMVFASPAGLILWGLIIAIGYQLVTNLPPGWLS